MTSSNVWYNPVLDSEHKHSNTTTAVVNSDPNDPGHEYDAFGALNVYFDDPLAIEPPLLFTFPSLKDKAWKHKDKVCCQILALSHHKWYVYLSSNSSCKPYPAIRAIRTISKGY